MKKTLIFAIGFFGFALTAGAQTSILSFSPQTVTLKVGETVNVTVTGPSNFYIGNNGNPAVASAAIVSANTLSISGYLEGTDSISICMYGSAGVSCSSLGVTVQKKTSSSAVSSVQTMTLSRDQIELNIGETKTIQANGSGNGYYYISSVSNPEIAAASVPGSSNQVSVTASSIGGSNVTVCQFGGTCATLYVYVPPSTSNLQAAQTVKNPLPLLSSFYVASNDLGGSFLGKGAILTLKFSTSIDVVSETLTVGGTRVQVNGAGSGPFSGTYTVTGSEPSPLVIDMAFITAAGVTGHSSMTVGGTTVPVSSPVSSSVTSAFTQYLTVGSSNSQVSALQSLLKKLGLYSGPVTGNFGPLTEAAVKKYQQSRGLDQVGVVGPGTRAALNKEQ